MDLECARNELDALLTDRSLLEMENLEGRVRALDTLDFVQEIARVRGREHGWAALARKGVALRRRLEKVNHSLYRRLQAEIRRGGCNRPELLALFRRCAGPRERPHVRYGGLDALIDGLLGVDQAPAQTLTPELEMVHLESTPGSVILDLVERVSLGCDDVFYDLGAGLGHVAIVVHLLTGVTAYGIEVEAAYWAHASRAAARLGLLGVRFIHVDARQADYSAGTVFYMFTPFTGGILQAVLSRLRAEAIRRPIRVCTYGPCTPVVARETWLRNVDGHAEQEFRLAVFESK